jgi:type VI secretion system protein ImpA
VAAQAGLTLINCLIERYWDSLHPELDAEDDNDPTMRVNALAPLVASEAFIDDLRNSWILKGRTGVLTIRGIELSQGKLQAREGEEVFSEAQVTGLLAEALAQNAELGAVIDGTIQVVTTLSSTLQSHVGASRSLDFKPLQSILHSVRQAFLLAMPAAPEEESVEQSGSDDGAHSTGGGASGRSGEVRSRQDVIAGIDKLIQYLERAEPTNPAQILLKRAKRMVNMNFLEALHEIAPDALAQAELILGDQLNKSEN